MSIRCYEIDGFSYLVEGVNNDLLDMVIEPTDNTRDLITNIFEKIDYDENGWPSDLICALSSNTPSKSFLAAQKIIQQLWNEYPQLGPLPFLQTLGKFQYDRKYYSGYRDHVLHSLKVFLLGLYLYLNIKPINTRINYDIQKEDEAKDAESEFIIRWLSTAFYHDLGYVFEADATLDYGGIFKEVETEVNKILATPVSFISTINLTSQEEKNFYEGQVPSCTLTKSYDELGRKNERDDILKHFDVYADRAHLGNIKADSEPLVRKYYRLALGRGPDHVKVNRSVFMDHGVVSACLFMIIHNAFESCLESMLDSKKDQSYILPYLADIQELYDKTIKHQDTVLAASGAISLHNIKNILSERDGSGTYLTLHNFNIPLDVEGMSLSFLLRLADELQDWGRTMYCAPRPQDVKTFIHDQQFRISCEDDKVLLWYQSNGDGDYLKKTVSNVKNKLKEILQPDAIDAIIDVCENPGVITDKDTPRGDYRGIKDDEIRKHHKEKVDQLGRVFESIKRVHHYLEKGLHCTEDEGLPKQCVLHRDVYDLSKEIVKCDREIKLDIVLISLLDAMAHDINTFSIHYLNGLVFRNGNLFRNSLYPLMAKLAELRKCFKIEKDDDGAEKFYGSFKGLVRERDYYWTVGMVSNLIDLEKIYDHDDMSKMAPEDLKKKYSSSDVGGNIFALINDFSKIAEKILAKLQDDIDKVQRHLNVLLGANVPVCKAHRSVIPCGPKTKGAGKEEVQVIIKNEGKK